MGAGRISAGTVVQLYAEFPAEAEHPAPLLKSFQKTALIEPGSSVRVVLKLTARDLSYYDARAAGWKQVASFKAHVGESSRDIRTVAEFHRDAQTTGNIWAQIVGSLSRNGQR